MYKNNNIECVLCGKENCKLTKEHHPTKSLIEHKIYCEYLIFPSCNECNNYYSKFEQVMIYLLNYFDYFYYQVPLKENIFNTFEKNRKLQETITDFYNKKNCREKIKIKYLYPVMKKYALIHNYISCDYFNDKVEVKVTFFKFLDEITDEEYIKMNSLEKIELLCEEMQLEYFGKKKILQHEETNYLASNYLIINNNIYMAFNEIYPNEYKFMLYQDSKKYNIKHLKLIIKNTLFCKMNIIDNS